MTDQLHTEQLDDAHAADTPRGVNRRRMFIAGAGLAGAAALAKTGSAAAADGGNAVIGEENEGEDGATVFRNTKPGTTALAGAENALVGDIANVANGSHAIKGVTKGAGHSVAGDTPADAEDGSGGPNTTAATWGRHGGAGAGIGGVSADGYGGEFVGGKAHVRLIQDDTAPAGAPSGAGHLMGELYVDGAGDLWFNTADGENFARLTGGGITMLSDPQRAFDSREDKPDPANSNKGIFATDETRAIDLTEFTDFPAGASGAIINLTVAQTTNRGYLTVFNGATADADRPLASSINWVGDDIATANGVTVPVSAAGAIKVYAKDATHVIIDVQGFVA